MKLTTSVQVSVDGVVQGVFRPADSLPDAILPAGVPVHLFHGLADDTVPAAHADLYARVIPAARMHKLPGRDHQLGNDMTAVARVIHASSGPR